METEELISANEFCRCHHIELTFVSALHEMGLIELTVISETPYVYREQLSELEKMMRLHYELDINMEGIGAIATLLKRVDDLNMELTALRNRLRLYEEID